METKEGIIQRIKSDRKALAIENIWYNSFKPLDNSIKVGNEVKLVYSIKGDFKNIKSLEPIKNETKELLKEKVVYLNNEKKDLNKDKPISNQTENTIILASTNILTTKISNGYKFTKEEFETKLNWLMQLFKKEYNKL
jgi:hypothetical protein